MRTSSKTVRPKSKAARASAADPARAASRPARAARRQAIGRRDRARAWRASRWSCSADAPPLAVAALVGQEPKGLRAGELGIVAGIGGITRSRSASANARLASDSRPAPANVSAIARGALAAPERCPTSLKSARALPVVTDGRRRSRLAGAPDRPPRTRPSPARGWRAPPHRGRAPDRGLAAPPPDHPARRRGWRRSPGPGPSSAAAPRRPSSRTARAKAVSASP